jgi:hypothetical protein
MTSTTYQLTKLDPETGELGQTIATDLDGELEDVIAEAQLLTGAYLVPIAVDALTFAANGEPVTVEVVIVRPRAV